MLPAVQREGRHVDSPDFEHASGPFGLDVFEAGGWLDFEQRGERFREVVRGELDLAR